MLLVRRRGGRVLSRARLWRARSSRQRAGPPRPPCPLARRRDRGLEGQERRWLADTWRRYGGLGPDACDRALGALVSRHGAAQHLVYYLGQLEAVHLRDRNGRKGS